MKVRKGYPKLIAEHWKQLGCKSNVVVKENYLANQYAENRSNMLGSSLSVFGLVTIFTAYQLTL